MPPRLRRATWTNGKLRAEAPLQRPVLEVPPGLSVPAERHWLRSEARRRRHEILPELQHEARVAQADRAARVEACREQYRSCVARARADTREKIERTGAALQTEREAERKMKGRAASLKSERGRAGGRRAAELRGESDDAVRFELKDDPDLIALFNRIRHKIKATPGRSRIEAFHEFVADNPGELAAVKAEAERRYEAEAERAFRERATSEEEAEAELDDEMLAEIREINREESFPGPPVPF